MFLTRHLNNQSFEFCFAQFMNILVSPIKLGVTVLKHCCSRFTACGWVSEFSVDCRWCPVGASHVYFLQICSHLIPGTTRNLQDLLDEVLANSIRCCGLSNSV